METMQKAIFIVLVGALGHLSAPAHAKKPLDIQIKHLKLDPSTPFEATVTNRSKEKVRYMGITIEQRQRDGSWSQVRWNTRCPCRAKCKMKLICSCKKKIFFLYMRNIFLLCEKMLLSLYRQ